MSQPGLSDLLFDHAEVDATTPELGGDERYLLSHLVTAAALLISQRERYPDLLSRRREEGDSAEVRATAHDSAEEIAGVLQSACRRRHLLVVAQETPLNPSGPIGMLDQLFFSLCLLSGPEDSLESAALSGAEVDELWESLDVQPWLEELGAAD